MSLIRVLCAMGMAWGASGLAASAPLSPWSSDAWLNVMFARDSVRWRIPHVPNESYTLRGKDILSELSWKPLRSVGLEGGVRVPFAHPRLMAMVQGQVAMIYGGHCRDSDWWGPNFALEYSRSRADVSGWSASGQAMLGYHLGTTKLSFVPLIGLDGAHLSLKERNMTQLFSLGRDSLTYYVDQHGVLTLIKGEIYAVVRPEKGHAGPVSSYAIDCTSALLGGELYAHPCESLRLQLLGWGGLGTYHAEADWMLREEFQHPKSFVHSAMVGTWSLEGGIYWQLTPRLGFNLRGGARQTSAGEGRERLNLVDDAGGTCFWYVRDISWKRGWVSTGLTVTW
ncbi:MAG: hypothetical protein ACOYKZ_02695 [Chlamydiia bacterium]